MPQHQKTTAAPAAAPEGPSSVERVTRWLDSALRSGGLAPGQRLVEVDIARQLGVARNSVREAMQRLAGAGIVVIERNRGPVVRALSRPEVAELFEIRERLEGLAAMRAAMRAADRASELAALHVSAGRFAETVDVVGYAAGNTAFHDWILAASASVWLIDLAARLSLPIFRLQFRAQLTAEALRMSHAQHARILAAIAAGDAHAAEAEMRAHIRSSEARVQLLPDELFRTREGGGGSESDAAAPVPCPRG